MAAEIWQQLSATAVTLEEGRLAYALRWSRAGPRETDASRDSVPEIAVGTKIVEVNFDMVASAMARKDMQQGV